MWHFEIWVILLSPPLGVVHSTWPSQAMWYMHALTFNKWHNIRRRRRRRRKVTLHILTHGAMRGCRLTSSVVCINDIIRDIRERNVTIRSEIWTTNIRSLGFRDKRVNDIMKVDITEFSVYMKTLASWPFMPKNLPRHWIEISWTVNPEFHGADLDRNCLWLI